MVQVAECSGCIVRRYYCFLSTLCKFINERIAFHIEFEQFGLEFANCVQLSTG